jgi:DNA-binding LacI/PurR family transcriptional regulator
MKRTKVAGRPARANRPPTLRELAAQLGLSPATVSLVLNGGKSVGIATETQALVRAKARELGYRPNFLARSLRTRRSYSVGVMIPGVSQGYNVMVLQGIEDYLAGKGYFYYVASHYLKPELVEEYARGFTDRAADGLILVSAPWAQHLSIPVATVSSYHAVKGTSSVLLDHRLAAELALRHLMELGHERIAFIKGTTNVPDTEVRWKAITNAARELGLAIRPRLVEPIVVPSATPQLGYDVTRKLLATGEPFSAVFAFNDVSAIGAIHALTDAGLQVPGDVSVVGFDDIESAGYMGPGLTTVRQPLQEMGRAAAESVLERIGRPQEEWANVLEQIVVKPELVVRETTAPPGKTRR